MGRAQAFRGHKTTISPFHGYTKDNVEHLLSRQQQKRVCNKSCITTILDPKIWSKFHKQIFPKISPNNFTRCNYNFNQSQLSNNYFKNIFRSSFNSAYHTLWQWEVKPSSSIAQLLCFSPAVPNRVFLDSLDPKQDFRESEMRFSRVRVCMFLDVRFLNRTEIYESLQVLLIKRTLSSLIIPANVTNLTTKLVNTWFTISALRCNYHAEDCRWCAGPDLTDAS